MSQEIIYPVPANWANTAWINAESNRKEYARSIEDPESGKIMRRILRKIARSDYNGLGDVSTLADPAVVEKLVLERKWQFKAGLGCAAQAPRHAGLFSN